MTSQSPLQVRSILRAFRGGSSWPVLVEAEGHRCVMKWSGSAEGPGANAADLIALRMARLIGIPVPTPRLLRVTESVADPRQDPELNDLVRRSLGINLGIEEVLSFEPYEHRHRDLIPTELRESVYALDLLLLNMDRIQSNPNMVMTPAGLLCWDYAAAMELRMLLNGRLIDERRFYPLLRQHPFFSPDVPSTNAWPAIDAENIQEMLADVPGEWLPSSRGISKLAETIRAFLESAPSTIRRRHVAVAELVVETEEDRTARTNANRRAFEEAARKLGHTSGSS